jgi:methionyl-tRNA synthetase
VHRTGDTGLFIGRKEFWGKGLAFEAWYLVIEYAFNRLGLRKIIAGVREQIDRQAFNRALDEIWTVVRAANRAIDGDAPWVLRKTDPDRMNAVLYVLMETIRHVAIVLQPFMPDSCGRILDQLSVPPESRAFAHLLDGNALVAGTAVPKPEPVFPRFVDDQATAEA